MTRLSRRRFGGLAGAAGAAAVLGHPGFAIAAAKPRVVVIGGGAGGATAAYYLAKDGGGAVDVTLIEARRVYSSSFFSNLYLGGLRPYASLNHNYAGLARAGIRMVYDRAIAVDTARKSVRLASGRTLAYDRLVVSPGIDIKYDSVPGYSKAAGIVAPHAYETYGPGKVALGALLATMPNGGTVAMVMPGNPYRCPPGPYERACMIAHYLKTRKPKSKLVILDPKKSFSKQPVFTEAFETYYKGIVDLHLTTDIDDHAVAGFDLKSREITTKAGKKVKFSIANVIPAQRAGEIAVRSGLAQGDWVPVDPETMRAKASADVYVLGDATVAAEMPKSAFAANSQAKVAVNQILADIAGKDRFPARYRNTCWSLLAPDDCVKIGASYAAKDGRFEPSAAFVSQRGEDAGVRKQNFAEAVGWYSGIVYDMFGKKIDPEPGTVPPRQPLPKRS